MYDTVSFAVNVASVTLKTNLHQQAPCTSLTVCGSVELVSFTDRLTVLSPGELASEDFENLSSRGANTVKFVFAVNIPSG